MYYCYLQLDKEKLSWARILNIIIRKLNGSFKHIHFYSNFFKNNFITRSLKIQIMAVGIHVNCITNEILKINGVMHGKLSFGPVSNFK